MTDVPSTSPAPREKFFLMSKTVQGIIVFVVPQVAALLGLDWDADRTATLTETITSFISLIGFGWALLGARESQQEALTLLPK